MGRAPCYCSHRVTGMDDDMLTRRALLQSSIHLAIVASTPMWVGGCKKEEFSCQEAPGLSEQDAQLRETLEYRDRSPHGEAKRCANCAFFIDAGEDQCGQCTLVKGPIHPLGYCSSWAVKT